MAIRPREQNIFDNYGLNIDYLGSQGMSPSQDIPPINDPFSQQSSTRDGYANMFGQNPPKSPFDVDFGQGKFDPITASQAPPSPPPVPQTSNPSDLDAIITAINKIYTPETTSRDRFNTLLDNMPERNKPSWGRKLVASGMGLGAKDPASALTTMEGAMYAPYIRDMAEFKEKAGPYQQAYQLENTANINERTLAGNVVTGQARANEQASRERIADQKNERAIERNRIANFKAQLGKGWTFDARNGTTVKAYNTTTGEVKDSGIATRWMDEADKVEAEGQYRVQAAEARAESAENVQAMKGRQNRQIFVDPENNVWEHDNSGQWYRNGEPSEGPNKGPLTKPSTGAGARTSQLEKNRIEQAEMKELYDKDVIARKYIKPSPDRKTYSWAKRPVITPPGMLGGGEVTQKDIDLYDEVRKEVDPTYVPPTNRKTGPPPISQQTMGEAEAEWQTELEKSRGGGVAPSPSVVERKTSGVRMIPDQADPSRQIQVPPPQVTGVQPVIQYSPSSGQYRISYDGEKTWRPFTPNFIKGR